ncbi:hypothetical protein ACTXJU_03640 [Glutamicibacter ardleyensis]|uniref:hypothetical protein n=1 Tax=Glutamicibacter ardleyensis TaxID=225894 RepID=UPI003FD1AD0F
MIFTSRTYRVAIRRSMEREKQLRAETSYRDPYSAGWQIATAKLINQTAHTAQLQRRKRRERK